MLTQSQIQQSYQSLRNGRQLIPVEKQIIPLEWKVRFQYITCQHYCSHCQKWNKDASYDYCYECGSDYYSHIDIKDGQIVPIRRGWCFKCKINLSLNEQFDCEACYYKRINDKKKAQEINLLRLSIKKEVETMEIFKQIERIKQVRKQMCSITMAFSGHVHFLAQQTKEQLKNSITGEMIDWYKNPDIPIKLNEELWKQVNKKAKELYQHHGICF